MQITLGELIARLSEYIQEKPGTRNVKIEARILGIDETGPNSFLMMFEPGFDPEEAVKKAVRQIVADPNQRLGKKPN